MATTKRVRIGEVLVDEGLLTEEALARALAEQKRSGRLLGEVLVEQEFISGEQLLAVLSKRLSIRGCHLRPGLVDPEMLDLIGKEEALRLKALPLFKVRDMVTVAMVEPQLLPTIDRLRQLTGCTVRPVLVLEGNLIEFIKKCSGAKADMEAVLASLNQSGGKVIIPEEEDDGAVVNLDDISADNPVVGLIDMVLLKAVHDKASDIHIEPADKATRIRYRLDGVLREMMQPPTGMHPLIVSRVKVLGKMDIAEKRLPQEGRVHIIAEGRTIDLRVSTMPTLSGEKLVIRLLDRANLTVRLEDLGFRDKTLAAFQRILRQPCGLVLVTGPTGSGKTTTLYSALEVLRSPERNIVTVEDPVEYQMQLVNQIQVQESIGMTFARALRSILRQDPDIIMIGEVRDEETAHVAVQAALTGHLVLATLHTNDACGAISRLMDMGAQPYLLAGALIGVVAQRLARLVCPNCAETYEPSENVLADAGLLGAAGRTFTRGGGCDLCHRSGFRGRMGVYEFMGATPKLSRMIHDGVSTHDIRAEWQRQGGLTLRQEGLLLAAGGQTSVEEVLSVTHSQGEVPMDLACEQLEETTAGAV